MSRCGHGEYRETAGYSFTPGLTGWKLRTADKHRARQKCTAQVFAHPGPLLGIFDVLCCEQHGRLG